MKIRVGDYLLHLTCDTCPEQYDVTKDGKKVAYLRLRHGHFSVRVPDHSGEEIMCGHPRGEGSFENDERTEWLKKATVAIASHYTTLRRNQ
jgi:hypothetical protein